LLADLFSGLGFRRTQRAHWALVGSLALGGRVRKWTGAVAGRRPGFDAGVERAGVVAAFATMMARAATAAGPGLLASDWPELE
jgi:hypothetical protein